MRFGIFMPVAFAAATTLAGGGGWSGMAFAASDAVSRGREPVQVLPENPSRDQQNDNSTGGVHRSGTTPTGQDKPSNNAAGPFAGTFDISTGPTNPNSPDLGSK